MLEQEPKKCVVCGDAFFNRNRKRVTCGKVECQRQNEIEKNRIKAEQKVQEKFTEGRIYILDEETWTWKLEKRGDLKC